MKNLPVRPLAPRRKTPGQLYPMFEGLPGWAKKIHNKTDKLLIITILSSCLGSQSLSLLFNLCFRCVATFLSPKSMLSCDDLCCPASCDKTSKMIKLLWDPVLTKANCTTYIFYQTVFFLVLTLILLNRDIRITLI